MDAATAAFSYAALSVDDLGVVIGWDRRHYAHSVVYCRIYGLLGEFPRFVGHPKQGRQDCRRQTARHDNQQLALT